MVCIGTLFLRPRYRAPWLWPDPARSKDYIDLLPPLLLLAGWFALAIALLPVSELVVAAWLVPFLAWVLAYHSLNRSGGGRPTWSVLFGLATVLLLLVLALRVDDQRSRLVLIAALGAAPAWMAGRRARRASGRQSALALPVNVSYGLAAGVFVTLTAVLPASAFFRIGHGMQLQSFIKYGQLQFALDRLDDHRRDEETNAKQIEALIDERHENERHEDYRDDPAARKLRSTRDNGAKDWGLYQSFFFSTAPAINPEICRETPADGGVTRANGNAQIQPIQHAAGLSRGASALLLGIGRPPA